MIESEIVGLIAQVGFPIVAFGWLAMKQQGTIERNTDAVTQLKALLEFHFQEEREATVMLLKQKEK